MNELKIFESADFGIIRTAGTSGEPLFCLVDICKALELNPSKVSQRLNDGVLTTHPIPDSLGRMQETNFVSEDGLYDVILDSRKPQARSFRKWLTRDVIPSIRKTGGYSITKPQMTLPEFQAEMAVATWVMDSLRLSDIGRLHMVKQISDKAGLTLPGEMAKGYMPSKGEKKSATELLKRTGVSISAVKFNQIAAEKGALEQLTRKGSKGNIHKWWSITKNYLEYGENDVNEKSPLETIAHWYADKFSELLTKLGIK